MRRKVQKTAKRILEKVSSWLEPVVWENIYSRRPEVPSRGPGFSGSLSLREGQEALARLRQDAARILPLAVPSEHLLLPFLLSLLAQKKDRVRVVDFGGGFGLLYQQILNGVIHHDRLEYHIIEGAEVCKTAAKEWAHAPQLHFHADQPTLPGGVDVLVLNSSLQYIDDYASLLRSLCQTYQPSYVFLGKLSSGEMPTYATAQINIEGSRIPYWFININEIIQIMADCRYRLIYKSTLEKEYPQHSFPESHRLHRAANLLFAKEA